MFINDRAPDPITQPWFVQQKEPGPVIMTGPGSRLSSVRYGVVAQPRGAR